MIDREVSHKALGAWLLCAMLGPVALTAAQSGVFGVLVTGALSALLCVTIHGFSDNRVWQSRWYCALLLLWNLYAGALVASQGAICWPGKSSQVAVPLVLIALAALSCCHGADRASRITATLCPLCVVVFVVLIASGIGNVRGDRISLSSAPPDGILMLILLLPITATAIPRQPGCPVGKTVGGITLFAVLISIAVCGTLGAPVALTQKDAFYEFSRSLRLFSSVQRFEAVSAVAVTCSVYAMLCLLFSAAGHLGENIIPGSGKITVITGAGLCGVIAAWKLFPQGKVLAILALLVLGICPLLAQFLPCKKM